MKKSALLSLTLFVTLLFLSACGVSQKDYDKLVSDLAAAQSQIQTLQTEKIQAENEALRSRLDATEAEIQSLKNQLAEAQLPNPSLRQEAATEFSSIQSAVTSMMTDQGLSLLPAGNITAHDTAGEATNNMATFPDANPTGAHLFNYGGVSAVNYVVSQNTKHKYWIDTNGTVYQVIVP